MADYDDSLEAAIDELRQDSVVSFYVGLLHQEGDRQSVQYRTRTDADDPQTARNAASGHLAVLLRVLAEQSGQDVETVAQIGVERARSLDSLDVREDDIV